MAAQLTQAGARNRLAVGYMLLSVGGFSLVPLVLARGAAEDPFLFNAGWRLGFGAGIGFFLFVRYRELFAEREVWTLIKRRAVSWAILIAVISQFEYAMFALSIRLIDVSIATILFETYHVLIILVTAWLFRRERRYRRIQPDVVLLLALGVAGFAFVVSGEASGIAWLGPDGWYAFIPGIFLAVLSAIVASLSAIHLKWGADLSAEMSENSGGRWTRDYLDLFCVLMASVIVNAVAIPLNAAAGMLTGETITAETFMYGMLWGFVINAMANIAWRYANLTTDNLGINALSYATPIFSLVWLFWFSEVNVHRADFLIIGAVAVIAANLLINFEAEVRFGFKALILALWGCGAFVYLRDDILLLLPFDGWLWPRETYLGALGLSATVFILLLTFRVARLAPRTQDEDNRIFALHRRLELLAWRNLISPDASRHVRAIDSARTPEELQRAYTAVKLCFVRAAGVPHANADRRLLADAEAQLNMMVHSRQQGLEFGELFSLIIFGGVTVVLSLLSRPEVYGWTAFLIEVFSTLFPAVIVFLVVNVWDLHRDRADLVLANQQDSEGFGVIFRDARSRRFEQSVSIIVGLLIIVSYAGLLWHKWVA